MSDPQTDAAFDVYAADYDAALSEGLAISGESKLYFARSRVAWLARRLAQLQTQPRSVMDYGCGTGTTVPFLFELLGAESVIGTDISAKSLEVARQTITDARAQYLSFAQYPPRTQIDLAYCNGVFHHIPPAERVDAVRYVFDSLRHGGLFAFWENNPWNPGTRYVMSRIPFDHDAITLSAHAARQLLRTGGFEIVRTDFLFIFPHALRCLRGLETVVAQLPFGAQYLVLGRKP